MSFKKRGSSKWTDTPNYIHNTFIDTITTLPINIYPTDTTATVGLKGQMEQNGTPTPTTPIQPSECGDMSSNLWSYHPDTTSGGVRLLWDGEKINYFNTCTQSSNSIMAIDLKKGTYTLKVNANRIPVENENSCIDIYHPSSGLFKKVTNRDAVNGKVTFTLDDDLSNVFLRIRVDTGTNYDDFEIRPMLNIGETSLPYDVYGQYKIPISSANTTTPIYLGEVPTTRRIKKSTVSITDIITLSNGNKAGVFTFPDSSEYAIQQYGLCDIAKYDIARRTSGMFYTNRQNAIFIGNSNDTLDTLKAIYDGCTLWYVLETPTTGIVNEPIRKIGDYADEVSGITIPTITGTNTINVDTTLKPSEVSVNYKGWHSIQSLHRFNGTSWD